MARKYKFTAKVKRANGTRTGRAKMRSMMLRKSRADKKARYDRW